MPIFEYVCRKCEHKFEALVQNSNGVECPSCQSRKLEKQLSVFSASTKGQAMRDIQPAPCGTCGDPRGPGSCSMS
jgi:putative FmdB family regulatory protein